MSVLYNCHIYVIITNPMQKNVLNNVLIFISYYLYNASLTNYILFMLISIKCIKNAAITYACRIIYVHIVLRFTCTVPFCAFIVLG